MAVGRERGVPCAIQYDPKTQRYTDIHDVQDARLPPYPAQSLSFSPGGDILCQGTFEMHAQSSYMDILNLWETSDLPSSDRHVMMRIQQPASGYLSSVAFSTRHDLLASGSSDGMLRMWDLKRYVCVGEVKAHEKPVNGVACSADGGLFATASSDRTVKLWKVEYG